jgi:hypothetical protein
MNLEQITDSLLRVAALYVLIAIAVLLWGRLITEVFYLAET